MAQNEFIGQAPPLSSNERQIFDYLIKPDDSYDSTGTYWADMPFGRKVKFVTAVDNAEAKREWNIVWNMFKKDPLEPMGAYFRNMVIPGAGLGLEGYVLFSIGNLQSLFAAKGAFSTCWGKHPTDCNVQWTYAVAYLEIVGIIIGQILVGFIGDYLGRRWGLIQDATIMFLGLIMLTAAWGVTLNGWVICYALSLLVYSIGVGGEYPMTATSAMENAVGSGKVSTREDRLHRGRKVTSAFLMQGWGQLANQAILIVLLLMFHGGDSQPYTQTAVQWTYRISFAIPAVGTLWLVYFRAYKMKFASKQLDAQKKKEHITGYDVKSLKLTITYFGPRLIATAGTWFFNDVFFYGNKIFQGNFINIVSPASGSDVIPNWLWNLVNIGVSLVGYYLASFFIDNKLYGRKNMMTVGFLMDFILFVVPAFHFAYYEETAHVHAFQAMYFLSSFFNQFGPNSVTFVVAAECYPTPIRATAHGFSAACGKCGALLAAVLYNYIDDQTKFYFIPWWGLAGVIITVVFMPDTTGLDLKEAERRWAFIRAGKEEHYHGVAVHPQHLSLWERWTGVGKHYNAELDYRQKIEEMRGEWEEAQAARGAEAGKAGEFDITEMEADGWSSGVSTYFQTTARSPVVLAEERQVPGNLSLGAPGRSDSSDMDEKKGHTVSS